MQTSSRVYFWFYFTTKVVRYFKKISSLFLRKETINIHFFFKFQRSTVDQQEEILLLSWGRDFTVDQSERGDSSFDSMFYIDAFQ